MKSAVISGLIVFVIVFTALSLVELLIHRLRHNTDKSYRWGVWVFSILLGIYAFGSALGR